MKTALVSGVTGQDGAYLTELLLGKGYRVVGTYRRSASGSFWRLDELRVLHHGKLSLVQMDLLELPRMLQVLRDVQPDEIYNLAAQSHVHASFDQPLVTTDITGMGPLRLLECARQGCPTARFYQASSSEMFGNAPMDVSMLHHGIDVDDYRGYGEDSPMCPRSPYGFSKLLAYWATRNYREAHGMFACNGILFNHESPLRGIDFVTRKITDGVARIACGERHVVQLGNLDAKRDWGWAPDYVRGMWMMLQQDAADDYVLASGETHSVREFIEAAFDAVPTREAITWREDGGYIEGNQVVATDSTFVRPADIDLLLGDASKARRVLGWEPSMTFAGLVASMVASDIKRHHARRKAHA